VRFRHICDQAKNSAKAPLPIFLHSREVRHAVCGLRDSGIADICMSGVARSHLVDDELQITQYVKIACRMARSRTLLVAPGAHQLAQWIVDGLLREP